MFWTCQQALDIVLAGIDVSFQVPLDDTDKAISSLIFLLKVDLGPRWQGLQMGPSG